MLWWWKVLCPSAACFLGMSSMSSQPHDFIGRRALKSPLSFLPSSSSQKKWSERGVFVLGAVWAWVLQRWLTWKLQLSFSHSEGMDATMHLMGKWQVFICSYKQYVPLKWTAGIQGESCEIPSPSQFLGFCHGQSLRWQGHLPQPVSPGTGSLKGALGVLLGCHCPWKTPEGHFSINISLDYPPPKKR